MPASGFRWPPCPAPFNLAAHALRHADRLADKPALVEIGGDTWTYGALESAVLGTAAGLLGMGLRPGEHVLLRLGNSVDFPIAFLGAVAAGLVPAPTSAQLTEEEITRICADLAPRLVIQAGNVAGPDMDVPSIGKTKLRDLRDHPPAAMNTGDPDRPAYIVFTSGTSARPRGVVHAHRAIWARGMMIDGWEGLSETDRLLHAGAFNWTYTLGTGLLDPWSVGATALVLGDGTDPVDLGRHLKIQSATIFAAVPGIYRRLLATGLPSLPALRHGLSAGEKLPEQLRREWNEATGTDIHEAFGQSECSTFVSGSPTCPAPAGRIGRPQPGRKVAILAEHGLARPGEPGQLAIAFDDPGLMIGYLAEDDTDRRGGWRLTGDLATIDAEGWITYLGRDDDVMTAGGYRVSPLEVEAAALEVAGVAEAAAFEREVRPGVRVIALAYRGEPSLAETIEAHCVSRLAVYKRPRIIESRDALPKNPNGKLQRRRLREETA